MASNLPPGVSASDDHINGPRREFSEMRTCADCRQEQIASVAEWSDNSQTWECSHCSYFNEEWT